MKDNAVFICSGCSQIIYEGEHVFHILGEQFCAKCIENAKEVARKIEKEDGWSQKE